jgi:hypothetical protein
MMNRSCYGRRNDVSETKSLELRVSVGYRRHSVAAGSSSGEVLEEFEIASQIVITKGPCELILKKYWTEK